MPRYFAVSASVPFLIILHTLCCAMLFTTGPTGLLAAAACHKVAGVEDLALEASFQLFFHSSAPHSFSSYDEAISDCLVCALQGFEAGHEMCHSLTSRPSLQGF